MGLSPSRFKFHYGIKISPIGWMTGNKPSQRIVGSDLRTKLVSALGILPEGLLTSFIIMGGDDRWLRALAGGVPAILTNCSECHSLNLRPLFRSN
jgi:hypothetical protein